MTDKQDFANVNRDDLVQRVALMETMISEGRRSTARYGWVFVMWGAIYFVATGWAVFLPHGNFAWPVCVVIGIGAGIIVNVRRKRMGEIESPKSRALGAVWKMMGAGVTLFAFSAVAAHRADSAVYISAILFFVGLAHATSAVILRWGVQGAVAAIWWGSGIATLFVQSPWVTLAIFLTASFFGMILFGLYAMMLERRLPPAGMLQTA
jgi:hypothetical protein